MVFTYIASFFIILRSFAFIFYSVIIEICKVIARDTIT